MSWFKKTPSSKPADSKQVMTSREFGDFLFTLSANGASSFMTSLGAPELSEKPQFSNKKEEIDQVELQIAFMWLFFDRMQHPKYAEAFTRLHSRFMALVREAGQDERETWALLQRRYGEYRQAHRSNEHPEDTYGTVAHKIHDNILGLDGPGAGAGLIFWHFLTITIQEHIIASGNLIKHIQIQDT